MPLGDCGTQRVLRDLPTRLWETLRTRAQDCLDFSVHPCRHGWDRGVLWNCAAFGLAPGLGLPWLVALTHGVQGSPEGSLADLKGSQVSALATQRLVYRLCCEGEAVVLTPLGVGGGSAGWISHSYQQAAESSFTWRPARRAGLRAAPDRSICFRGCFYE